MDLNIKEVKLEFLSWKEEFKKDISSGKGFLITDKHGITQENKKSPNGIYSPKYGSGWGDPQPFAEKYSCECGALIGRLYEGEYCDKCASAVKFVDSDLHITGWLKLEKYHIIHPTLYHLIKGVIGKQLDGILDYSRKIDSDGKYNTGFEPTFPYEAIGLVEFKEKFDEILDFYFKKNKKRADEYELIKENRSKVFSKYIPIYTLLLRPIVIVNEDFMYAKVNEKYAMLVNKAYGLNQNTLSTDRKKIKVYPDLYFTQTIINGIHDMILDTISRKEGHIRSNILGGRFNFSSRNVIIPLADKCRMNEILLPYLGFLELYKPDLINLMMKMEHIDINSAIDQWNYAQVKFSPKMYELMKYLIDNVKGGLHVIINRNPSIQYGSVLCMVVAGVKKDYNDYTMSIPISVLSVLGADFDGDVLNIIRLLDRDMVKDKKALFDPRTNFMISRNDGLFNNDFNLLKDEMIGLNQFCSL